ncbi:MAG TPA: O-antigen ligase family protein, partial [Bryobacteraceae bacterium]|nr:O-antigen ligase family protein [Bryobacteraceae bacterium]
MTRPVAALAALLSYAVLAIWIEQRWAWGLVQLAVFSAAAAWAVHQLLRPAHVRMSLWLAPLAAAPVWGLAQMAIGRTIYRWQTWAAVLDWTTWLGLFFLALQLFESSEARQGFLRFTVYFGFGLSVFAVVQMFTSGGKIFWLFPSGYTNFVLGPFVNQNQYAAFLEMILPVALWLALRTPRRALAYWAMGSAMLASVVASASRAGTALMCAEVIAVLLLAWLRGVAPARTVFRGLASFAIVALAFTALVSWQPLRRRLWEQDPLAGRRELLVSSLHMLADRPVLGFGLGNWPRAYPEYALYDDGTYVNQAHNDWVQWAVEGGMPFLLLQLLLAVLVCPAALRSVWGIGLLSVWIHCLVDYPLQQRPAIGAWFFVLVGLLAATRGSLA